MKIVVTGADGFIGHHFVEHLLVSGERDIVAMCSFHHGGVGARFLKSPRISQAMADGAVRVVAADLTRPYPAKLLDSAGGADAMVCFASRSHVDTSLVPDEAAQFFRDNSNVALAELEIARKIGPKVFVLISTDEVYGPAHVGQKHAEWSVIAPSNPYCVTGETEVITPRGIVPIRNFSLHHHRVLCREQTGCKTGGYTPQGVATRKWEFDYCGDVYRVRTQEGGEEIVCSPDHRFFSVVNAHANGGRKVVEKKASELKAGDRVGVIRRIPFPGDLPDVDLSFARFLGYWIGDGSFGRCVRLADEKREFIDHYRRLAETVFGVSKKSATGSFGTVYKHSTKNCWYLAFASESQRRRVDLSSRDAVLEAAMNFPEKALGEFVAGWIDADGSVSRDGDLVTAVTICSFEKSLRRGLKFLLRRLGVVCSEDNNYNRLAVCDAESILALFSSCPSLKFRGSDRTRKPQRIRGLASRWIWARVVSAEKEPYIGKLYDLEVSKHHNYVASYFLVHNSASKAAQEAAAFSWWRAFGVPVVIVNSMNIVGERQHPEKFLPMVMHRVASGERVKIHAVMGADGKWAIGSRHFIHARNLASAVMFILAKHGRGGPRYRYGEVERPPRYHVAGDEMTNLELAQEVAAEMGMPLEYDLFDAHSARPGHDLRYALDDSLIRGMGWSPPIPLRESIRRIVRWTVENPEWMDPRTFENG